MISYKQGNLFSTDYDIIAHGVNCQGAFGSGVAGLIKKLYPEARVQYLNKFISEGWNTGDFQPVKIGEKIIVNCATQKYYLPRGKDHVDYEGLELAMCVLKIFAQMGEYSVAMPKIGSGLAGGDWNKIEKIINEAFHDYPVTVYYL